MQRSFSQDPFDCRVNACVGKNFQHRIEQKPDSRCENIPQVDGVTIGSSPAHGLKATQQLTHMFQSKDAQAIKKQRHLWLHQLPN